MSFDQLPTVERWSRQPAAQLSAAHASCAVIEKANQRGSIGRVGGLYLQIAPGSCIHHHLVIKLPDGERVNVRQFVAAKVLNILNQCACSGRGSRMVQAAESIEIVRAQ